MNAIHKTIGAYFTLNISFPLIVITLKEYDTAS